MKSFHVFDKEWIALLGNAGAGKTTISKSLEDTIIQVYSSDYRFIGDSSYRKALLHYKKDRSLDSYIDSMNQISWWNWDAIHADLKWMKSGYGLQASIPIYDRDSGSNKNHTIYQSDTLLYEGVMLPEMFWGMFDRIYYLYVPEEVRLQRLLKKDQRRSTVENIARFLICDYSEKLFYKHLFDKLDKTGKLIYIDSLTMEPMCRPVFDTAIYVPMEI